MYEVERKFRVDHAAIRDALTDTAAEPLGTVRQRDTYYQHPVRDFAESDEAVRLREEAINDEDTPVVRLTYKGPRLDARQKVRVEHETEVADGSTLDAILRAIDFEPVATVEKRRERYRVGESQICLDSVSDLGEFVEVEVVDEGEEVSGAMAEADALERRLGLDAAPVEPRTYLELLLTGER